MKRSFRVTDTPQPRLLRILVDEPSKDLDPMIQRISHHDKVSPDGNATRLLELAWPNASTSDECQKGRIEVKELNIVQRSVGDVDVPCFVHRDPLGPHKLPEATSPRTETVDIGAILAHDLDSSVDLIDYEQCSVRTDCQ